jgi:hypothetical protein
MQKELVAIFLNLPTSPAQKKPFGTKTILSVQDSNPNAAEEYNVDKIDKVVRKRIIIGSIKVSSAILNGTQPILTAMIES